MAENPQLRALARKVAALERARLQAKQPTLGFSTIDGGGAIQASDEDDVLTMIVGQQFDGSNAPSVVTGPTPPAPILPLLTAGPGSLRIYWDGTFEDGAVAPMDFARVLAYATPLASYVEPEPLNQAIMVGQFTSATGGEITAALDPNVEYAVYFHTWTIAGKYGPSSDVATATPGAQVLPEELAAKSTVYRQTTAPWPDGDTGHVDDIGDLWFNTSLGPGTLFNISSYSITSNVVTINCLVEHDLIVGTLVEISLLDPAIDGSYAVASVPDTRSFTFALTHADVPSTTPPTGRFQGQDVAPLNRPYIWDGSTWVLTQDADASAASTLSRDVKTTQQDLAVLAVTAQDAQDTAYAADGRVSISDYEPGPEDVPGKQPGSLWITRTRNRRNLCTNPSFETSTTGWGATGLTSAVRTAVSPAADGAYAVRLTNNGDGGSLHYLNTTFILVTADQELTLSGYLKSISGALVDHQAFINFYTSGFGYISTLAGPLTDLVTDDWTRLSISGIVPATAAMATFGFLAPAAATGAVWDLDAVLIEHSLELGRYFDGGSEGGSWVGTAELSESELDGNAIIRLFTLEDAEWTEKFWTADTIISLDASVIDRGLMDGAFIQDHTIAIDKHYMPSMICGENITAGDLVCVVNSGGLAIVYKADANNGRRASGYVLDTATTGNLVKVYTDGYNPLRTGMVPGPQWLDSVAGGCASAPPLVAGTIAQRVGYAIDSTTLVFTLGSPVGIT